MNNTGAISDENGQHPNGQGDLSTAKKDNGRKRELPTVWSNCKISEIKGYQIAQAGAIGTARTQTAIACRLWCPAVYAGIRARVLYGISRLEVSMIRVRCWLCRMLCRDTFMNADASREIDRLTLQIEQLRAGELM